MINYNSGIIHPSIKVYKEALNKVNGYSKDLKHAEDHDLFCDYPKSVKLQILVKNLFI